MFLPHIWANSSTLVGSLSFRIIFLLVAVAPHREGTVMDKTSMRVLFDTGANKSYMSKSLYMANTNLHTLPKFSTTSKGISVGNGQLVPVIFNIPVTCSFRTMCLKYFSWWLTSMRV